eukprot:694666-Pleurochrysis_carterae.AAC.1
MAVGHHRGVCACTLVHVCATLQHGAAVRRGGGDGTDARRLRRHDEAAAAAQAAAASFEVCGWRGDDGSGAYACETAAPPRSRHHLGTPLLDAAGCAGPFRSFVTLALRAARDAEITAHVAAPPHIGREYP